MRLCCNDSGINVSGDMEKNEQTLKQLHDIGFSLCGVYGAEQATDNNIKRLKDLAAKYEMIIAMSPTGYDVVFPDPDRRKKDQEGLKKTLVNLQKLGVDTMHVAGSSYNGDHWWQHPKNFTQEGLDELVGEMKKIAPYAEDAGVAICPETTQWCVLNSIERMKEYVDRIDSPYVKVTFDLVNHMRPDRMYSNGRFFRCVIATLGDRIGMLHVKDALPVAGLVVHINEAPMGTGLIDHAKVISASNDLEPWKLFSLEHFGERGVPVRDQWERAYKHITSTAEKIGYTWTDPEMTRVRWEKTRAGR